ncbi:uncharacterized protein LOC135198034 [Macrobrachium nipponense]|uniref:uncharacterized protein LOC135198034 n=1 Tax=Macrobrachium nipponense TaxID=159736 RepID=UPI0030C876FA
MSFMNQRYFYVCTSVVDGIIGLIISSTSWKVNSKEQLLLIREKYFELIKYHFFLQKTEAFVNDCFSLNTSHPHQVVTAKANDKWGNTSLSRSCVENCTGKCCSVVFFTSPALRMMERGGKSDHL